MKSNFAKEEYISLLKNDFATFAERAFYQVSSGVDYIPGKHIELIASKLEQCRRGEIKRLIINIPPRNMKSILASVALPAYILGHDPTKQIICASYGQDFSEKLASDCRAVMQAPWYKDIFPTRVSGRKSLNEFTTSKGGVRIATSIGGVVTGRGADFIIIDDPLKAKDGLSESIRRTNNQSFDNTFISRLNDKQKGCIIVIMQRLHEDDLTGHLLQQEGWEILSLPAIAERDEIYEYNSLGKKQIFSRKKGEALHPEREPLEVLNKIKTTMSGYDFAGQYQQRPAPLDGGMIKREWFQVYDTKPPFERIIQAWDTAAVPKELNDYSVCTTWGIVGKKSYLIDVYRDKLDFPGLKRALLDRAIAYGAKKVLVEEASSGIQLVQELRFDGYNFVTGVKVEGNKVMRMNAQTPRIEAGNVLIPKDALWREDYLHEMTTFPYSKHDDQVDSTSLALGWLTNDECTNWPWEINIFHNF